jgi:hypothetical protein
MDFILLKNQKFIFVHGKILAVERKKKKQSFLFLGGNSNSLGCRRAIHGPVIGT